MTTTNEVKTNNNNHSSSCNNTYCEYKNSLYISCSSCDIKNDNYIITINYNLFYYTEYKNVNKMKVMLILTFYLAFYQQQQYNVVIIILQFLPEPRFEPTTSGCKSSALSIRPRLTLILSICNHQCLEIKSSHFSII